PVTPSPSREASKEPAPQSPVGLPAASPGDSQPMRAVGGSYREVHALRAAMSGAPGVDPNTGRIDAERFRVTMRHNLEPRRERVRALPWLVALVSLLATVGMGVYLLFFSGSSTPASTTAPVGPSVSSSAAAVRVLLESNPSGARVTGPGGKVLGKTPQTFEVPSRGLEVFIELDGYQRVSVPLAPPLPPRLL